MNHLEKYLQGYFGVSKEDVAHISALFQPTILKKGEHFLKSGRYSDRLGFVQEGVIREYVLAGNKEITKWIATSGYSYAPMHHLTGYSDRVESIAMLLKTRIWGRYRSWY